MKALLFIGLLLLLGIANADQFTFQGQGVVSNSNLTQTETWQIGYGAQQIAIAGNQNNILLQAPLYGFLIIVWVLAGWLIYNSFKKTSANSKKEYKVK